MSDLIRREDAIKVLKHHLDEDYLDGYVYLNELEALPSAEPKRKTGEWLEKDVCETKGQIEEWQSAKCSVCGKYHTTPYLYSFDNYPYCPNCGAEMRGEDGKA